jgi:hypothetical protein
MTGREDGYAGNWDPKHSVAGGEKFRESWPLRPTTRPTLLTLGVDHNKGYHWTCRECGWTEHTSTYTRPKHDQCLPERLS